MYFHEVLLIPFFYSDKIHYVSFYAYAYFDSIVDKYVHGNGLVQERRNSIANALELRLSCTNPSMASM